MNHGQAMRRSDHDQRTDKTGAGSGGTGHQTEGGEVMKTTKEQRATYRSLFAESQSPLASFVKQMIDGLEAAEAEVQRLREQTQWRPIETCDLEYASTDAVILKTYSSVTIGWWFKHFGCWSDGRKEIINPTHWLPFPQPPQESDGAK